MKANKKAEYGTEQKRNRDFLVRLLNPYFKTIVLILGCLILSAILNLIIPLLSRMLMDEGLIASNKVIIIQVSIVLLGIHIVCVLIDIVKEKSRIKISAKIEFELSQTAFRHLLKLKVKYYNVTNYGEMLSNIETDVENIRNVTDNTMFFAITQIFNIVGGIVGLSLINPGLTFLVLVFLPVKYVFINILAKKREAIFNQYIEKQSNYFKWFGDTISGIREIKIFRVQKKKYEEFVKNKKEVIACKNNLEWYMQLNGCVDTVLLNFLLTLIYIVSACLMGNIKLSVGSIFTFVTYSTFVIHPISSLLNIRFYLSGIFPSVKRYRKFMEAEEEEDGFHSQVQNGIIEFRQVGFSYQKNKSLLSNVSFTIAPKEKIAIIGKNGTGKSTLIQMLLRFSHPDHGSITLGNTAIGQFSLEAYRELFAFISQQVYLFNDTIYNNICLFKEVTDSEFLAAVRNSGLEDLIQEKGKEYCVGENGSLLSGGQKQRIALARAIVTDAPILIFDEATSNIDVTIEALLHNILRTSLKEKTVIMITHKAELLVDVDKILILEQGTVVSGVYDSFIKDNSFLREMSAVNATSENKS